MKTSAMLCFCLLLCSTALADTHYVDINNATPSAPYTSWGTAATNIQSGVDASGYGDMVMVADGTYNISSVIYVNKGVTISSVNGADATVINADYHCGVFYLDHPSCEVVGFSVINGSADYGGGIYCADFSPIVSRCIIMNNVVGPRGVFQGGYTGGYGGGMFRGEAHDCIFAGNRAYGSGLTGGGRGGGMSDGSAINCTITGNYADIEGGGVFNVAAVNSIIYYNSSYGDSVDNYGGGFSIVNCCTIPSLWSGYHNITSEPLFVDKDGGNYRLSPNSPCINAGDNYSVSTATDLDGNPRIIGGTVDVGAYEYYLGYVINCYPVDTGFALDWIPDESWDVTVQYSTNLGTMHFTDLSAPMPYPINSYTDLVHGAENACFYKVEISP